MGSTHPKLIPQGGQAVALLLEVGVTYLVRLYVASNTLETRLAGDQSFTP